MDFFDRFAWAVPLGFVDAVGLCRFEEGDILYDSPEAYKGTWADALQSVRRFMQVRSPARAVSRTDQGAGGVFESNWRSSATVDLYLDGKKVDSDQKPTTQGRIYTAIWHGDLEVLDLDTDEPPVPLSVGSVTKKLSTVVVEPPTAGAGERAFIMPRDRSNQVSRSKFAKIHAALGNHLCGQPEFLSPRSAGLKEWREMAPTIDIAIFNVKEVTRDDVEALVKAAVYAPSRDATKDMFRLGAHGVVYEWK